jgi:phosphocarrier protein FPr/phosphocarrier protein
MIASAAKHAITLRAECGAEILIHVGLDTVALAGQGFIAHVKEGRSVRAGDPLLTFDLDHLARNAKSLISPIVITNGDEFAITRRNGDREAGVGEFLMELKPLRASSASPGEGAQREVSRDVEVPLAHGLHARPAAVLANAAKRFSCEIALVRGGRRVNARSVAALMSLGAKCADTVTITASGADAAEAVDALAVLIAQGLGETPTRAAAPVATAQSPAPRDTGDANLVRGVSAAPGLAIGRIAHLKVQEIAVAENGAGISHEAAELARALAAVRTRLEASAATGDRQRREILGAHLALLDDPELVEAAHRAIGEGKSAGFAWRQAVRNIADALEQLDDPRLRERADDLRDLERQVLGELTGATAENAQPLPPNAILVARELLPSQLIALAGENLAGFCTAGGGPTAHVAILAAGMNIPAIVGAGDAVLALSEGSEGVLDADAGELRINADEAALGAARRKIEERRKLVQAAAARAAEECRTADGTRIEVFANLGAGAAEAAKAVAQGAEGCGLLRTEFLFQERTAPPSEDEQFAEYQAIANALGGRPFIIRTFDIGGDKPVSYLSLPAEENPALGLRGVRTGLWRPDLLRTQLAAILRVAPAGQCRIMLPMISALSELQAVRGMLEDVARERGVNLSGVELGVMVETPASAVTTDRLAEEADFFSIGTNDLTQYVLAMDRGNPQLAGRIDALHPAVLRLIAQAVRGARGKTVAVCGGLAADRLAAPLLIGLGVTELSVPSAGIPALKQAIRGLRLNACRALGDAALALESAEGVRALLTGFAREIS